MAALSKVQARGQVTLPREIRRAAGIRPGDTVIFEAVGPDTVTLHVLPRLTLAEMFERYRIEGPIDEPSDREAWQAEAAKDIIGAPHG
jgi:AbrB family looped-hinge helix DNA binding protein